MAAGEALGEVGWSFLRMTSGNYNRVIYFFPDTLNSAYPRHTTLAGSEITSHPSHFLSIQMKHTVVVS